MRKSVSLILAALLFLSLPACGADLSETRSESGRLQIVTTVFPAYDFARHVAGERAEVTLLVPAGAETHGFEPTARDIARMESADLLVANGGESEVWLETVLNGLEKTPETLYMLGCVDAVEEETVEGMQFGGVLSRETETDGPEYDEHVWTSPANAITICRAIYGRLCAIDPDGAGEYAKNLAAYEKRLRALDEGFRVLADEHTGAALIFADRFPVRYFTEEYGFEYYAAFLGCADDAEPSARTVAFLIDKVRGEKVKAVFYIEFSNEKMADIICEETGCEKLLFHSCHNVTAEQLSSGVSYAELMEGNLKNLKEALG